MSMIVVSPSTGTSALGSVSVYGRSLRPAPAASTRPIMGWFLPKVRGVPAEDSGGFTYRDCAGPREVAADDVPRVEGKACVPPTGAGRKSGRRRPRRELRRRTAG